MKFSICLLSVAAVGIMVAGCEKHHESKAELNLNSGEMEFKADSGDGNKTDMKLDSKGLSINAESKEGSHVNLDASEEKLKVKANDKNGSFENNLDITESDVKLDYYPGSVALKIACLRASNKDEDVWVATRTTSDSASKVIDFYASKLENPHKKVEDNKTELTAKTSDGDDLTVGVESKEGGKTTVSLARRVKKNSK